MTLNNAFTTFTSDLWLAVDPPGRFERRIWEAVGVVKFTPNKHVSKYIRGKPRLLARDCQNVFFYSQDEWFKREQMFAPHDPMMWDNRDGRGGKTSLMDGIRVLYLLGIRQIFLLGVDFHQSVDHAYHYSKPIGPESIRRNNQLYSAMSGRLTRLRPLMEDAGLRIYNCNPNSRLEVFEHLDLQAALRSAEEPAVTQSPTQSRMITSSSESSVSVPDVTLITPTGDRPIPFRLCEWWMKKQTFKGTVQWIVVDDGKEETFCTMGQQYVRRQPQPDDPRHTLARNLLAAIPYIKSNKILIIEDDAWYSPHYVEKMTAMLEGADLIGLRNQIYYRFDSREWVDCGNQRRASMCQTGFTSAVIPVFRSVCEEDFRSIDIHLWRDWRGSKELAAHDPGAKLSIGMKQLPGRRGRTSGWRNAVRGYRSDVKKDMLKAWLGIDAMAYVKGRSITFRHSGCMGDVIFALPTIQALGGGHLYLRINAKSGYPSSSGHIGSGVRLTQKMAEFLIPLLESQPSITGVSIWRDEHIDFDLDQFRRVANKTRKHLAQTHLDAFDLERDLTEPWLTVDPDQSFNGAAVINRTARYNAPDVSMSSYDRIRHQFERVVFLGTADEYGAMVKQMPSLERVEVSDAYRAAQIIAGCRLFVGNQSLFGAIAEGLKIPRVQETCPRIATSKPVGGRGRWAIDHAGFTKAIRASRRVLLLGADESNPGDKIVEAGCRHRVAQQWPDAEMLLVDVKHPENAAEADILVVCGTPWLAAGGGPKWRRESLSKVIRVSRARQLEAWGIGGIYCHGQEYQDPASVRGAHALFSEFNVVEARDPIAHTILELAGVECILKPCPSMDARQFYCIRPSQSQDQLHIFQSLETASMRKRLACDTDFIASLDEAQRRCVEAASVLCYTEKDASFFRRRFPRHDCMTISDPKKILEMIGSFRRVTSVRVHGALPALSLGCKVEILPLDSRGSAAIWCGAKIHSVLQPQVMAFSASNGVALSSAIAQ